GPVRAEYGRTTARPFYQDTFNITYSWGLSQQHNNSDTLFAGNSVAYTWDLGGGATLILGADERRTKSLTNLWGAAAAKIGAEPTTSVQGERWPDLHVDFKLDQAWGYFAASF